MPCEKDSDRYLDVGATTQVDWQSIHLVASVQHPDASYSIYRCYMCGCRYPGAAADRPPRAPPSKHPGAAKRSRSLIPARPPKAPPSKHPGAAKRSRGLNAAMPGSSPLSMRLGLWSGWVGKQETLQLRRKASPKRILKG